MIRTSVSKTVSRLIARPVNGAKLSSETVMKKLFANGEQGFWYDPNDLSTMFQDEAGTVPVTGEGQAVGLIRDKSGRNNHAYQTTKACRPILRKNAVTGSNYLEFDGSDDFLQTADIDFTGTDKLTVIAAIGKLSDIASYPLVYELSANAETNNGSFRMMTPGASAEKGIVFGSRGTSQTSANIRDYPAPIKLLTTMQASIGTPLLKVRVNGVQVSNIATSQGTGNYGKYPLYIGRRGGTSFPFNGHLYGLIGIGRLTSDSETKTLEKELAKRLGVTLNV